jgi:hypothetical protein
MPALLWERALLRLPLPCSVFVRVELVTRPFGGPHKQYEKAARGLSTKIPARRLKRSGEWLLRDAHLGEDEGVVEGRFAEGVVAAGGAAVAGAHVDLQE